MRGFDNEKLGKILSDLERLRPKGRAVAAFDADGTLWDTDLGEALFDYQIKNKLVPLPKDPWGHYNYLKENESHPVAYLWLAQINKGVPESTLREWAENCVSGMYVPIFEEQKIILAKLKELEVETYIVTASIRWAVEPGARRLGLDPAQVIGIETHVENGLITDAQKGVITYREGKAEAILERTGGVAPYFSSGNTEGDRWLLEASSALRLVMSAAPPEARENFATEMTMIELAKQNGWYWHRYR